MGKDLKSAVNNIEFYNLEKIKFVVKDGTGLDIAYAYEDLVFSEHGIFIMQFNDSDGNLMSCWFNNECIESDRVRIYNSLCKSADLNSMKISYKGKFDMKQAEGEEKIVLNFEER